MPSSKKTWRGIESYTADVRLDRILDTQGDGTGSIEMAVAAKSITGVSTASPGVITSAAHGFSDGDHVTITGVVGATEVNGFWLVANKADNTFEVTDMAGTAVDVAGTYSSGGSIFPAFVVKPPAGEFFHIERLNLIAGDSAAPVAGSYLGLAALTNGIVVEVRNAAGIVQTLTSIPVKSWADWGLNAGSDIPVADLTAGNTDAAVRWTFSKSGPRLLLTGDDGVFLVLRATDALDGLVYQRAAVQGVI